MNCVFPLNEYFDLVCENTFLRKIEYVLFVISSFEKLIRRLNKNLNGTIRIIIGFYKYVWVKNYRVVFNE